jgi:hypothetical protein
MDASSSSSMKAPGKTAAASMDASSSNSSETPSKTAAASADASSSNSSEASSNIASSTKSASGASKTASSGRTTFDNSQGVEVAIGDLNNDPNASTKDPITLDNAPGANGGDASPTTVNVPAASSPTNIDMPNASPSQDASPATDNIPNASPSQDASPATDNVPNASPSQDASDPSSSNMPNASPSQDASPPNDTSSPETASQDTASPDTASPDTASPDTMPDNSPTDDVSSPDTKASFNSPQAPYVPLAGYSFPTSGMSSSLNAAMAGASSTQQNGPPSMNGAEKNILTNSNAPISPPAPDFSQGGFEIRRLRERKIRRSGTLMFFRS